MKQKYGSVIPGEERISDRTLTEDGQTVPDAELYEIIRTRVEELVRLILLELPNDYSKYIRSGMVLTGGTTNLPGMAELGLDVTHMPVRIGTPPQLYGVSDSLIDPAFSTAVGLLLWKQSHPDTTKSGNTGASRGFMSDLGGLFGRNQTS